MDAREYQAEVSDEQELLRLVLASDPQLSGSSANEPELAELAALNEVDDDALDDESLLLDVIDLLANDTYTHSAKGKAEAEQVSEHRRTKKNQPKSKAFVETSADEDVISKDPGGSFKRREATDTKSNLPPRKRQKLIGVVLQHTTNGFLTRGLVETKQTKHSSVTVVHESAQKQGGHDDPAALFDDDVETATIMAPSVDGNDKTTIPVVVNAQPQTITALCSSEELRSLADESVLRVQNQIKDNIGMLSREIASQRREFTAIRHQYNMILSQHFAMKKIIEHLEWDARVLHGPPIFDGHKKVDVIERQDEYD